ncbi:MAG: hypothetical protein ABFD81_17595 [Syntrophaceae bacterium]
MLDPQLIADTMTLAAIDAQIVLYQAALDDAVEVGSYDLSDTQSRQKVESQDPQKVAALLQAYMKAKQLKSGLGGPVFLAGRFVR